MSRVFFVVHFSLFGHRLGKYESTAPASEGASQSA